MKLTDEQKRKQNKEQYDALCRMLWDELNRALESDRRGKVGVSASVADGIIKTRHFTLDLSDNNARQSETRDRGSVATTQ